jgi:anaerobic ribonucleoside-triphosphate reductase
MIDGTVQQELIDIVKKAYVARDEAKDTINTAKVIIKESKTEVKDWAKRNELTPTNVEKVIKDYMDYRNGLLKWGESDEKDDEYVSLQMIVQDAVLANKKG